MNQTIFFLSRNNEKKPIRPELTFNAVDILTKNFFAIQNKLTQLTFSCKDNTQVTSKFYDESTYKSFLEKIAQSDQTTFNIDVQDRLPQINDEISNTHSIQVIFQQQSYWITLYEQKSYQNFLNKCRQVIPHLATNYDVSYNFQENDKIKITNDTDFEIYQQLASTMQDKNSSKLHIYDDNADLEQNTSIPTYNQNQNEESKELESNNYSEISNKNQGRQTQQEFYQNQGPQQIQQYNNHDIQATQKQRLVNMFNDAQIMPEFSQKYLNILLYYLGHLTQPSLIQEMNETYSCIEEMIEILLILLQTALKQEMLYSEEIELKFNEAQEKKSLKHYNDVYKNIKFIKDKIQPFDVEELKRLIKQARLATNLIKSNAVIILLGKTGVGKSAIAHYLCGSEMKKIKINGLPHIGPVQVFNEGLQNVVTSPFPVSQTKHITPISVQYNKIPGCEAKEGSLIIIDSPGENDTNGPEQGIANAYGISLVINQCNSIRPVFVISVTNQGAKLQDYNDIAITINQMTNNLPIMLKSVQFIFTKHSQEQRDTLVAQLESRQSLTSNNNDDNEMTNTVINQIIQQIKQDKDFFIDLLDQQKSGILLGKLVTKKPIENPSNYFQEFIPESSNPTLMSQIQVIKDSAFVALESHNYSLICFRLGQIKFLVKYLKLQYINQHYQQLLNQLLDKIKSEQNTIIQSFQRSLKIGNEHEMSEIEDYKQLLGRVNNSSDLRDYFKELEDEEYYNNILNNITTNLIEQFDNPDTQRDVQNKILNKIKIISSNFPQHQSLYSQYCSSIIKLSDNIMNQICSQTKDANFKSVSILLGNIEEICLQLSDHLELDYKDKYYCEAIKYLKDFITNKANEQVNILQKEQFDEHAITAIKEFSELLEKIQCHSHDLKKYIQMDEIIIIQGQFHSQTVIKAGSIINQILRFFQQQQVDNIKKIELLFNDLTKLRTIQKVEYGTQEKFDSLLQTIGKYLDKINNEIKKILQFSEQLNSTIDPNELAIWLKIQQSYQWFQHYNNNNLDEINMVTMQNKIKRHLQLQQQELQSENLGIDNHLKIQQIYQQVVKIQSFDSLINLNIDLKSQIEITSQWFFTGVKETFEKSIRQQINIQSLSQGPFILYDYEKIMEVFNFLNQFKKIYSLKEEAQNLLQETNNFISEYKNVLKIQYESSYENILKYEGDDYAQQPLLEQIKLFESLSQLNNEKKEDRSLFYRSEKQNSNVIQDLKKKLLIDSKKLYDDMIILLDQKDYKQLKHKIFIVEKLSQLDCYIDNEDRKFTKIYNYFQVYFQVTQSRCNMDIINNLIIQQNYEEIKTRISPLLLNKDDINNKIILDDTKILLNMKVAEYQSQILKDANYLLRVTNVDIMQIQRLGNNLQLIQNQKSVSDLLEFNSQSYSIQQPEKYLDMIKNIINQYIKDFIQKINNSICNNDIYQVDLDLAQLQEIYNELGIFSSISSININENIESLQNDKLQKIQQKKDFYKEKDFIEYLMEPPKDIINNLQQATNQQISYNQDINEIQDIIIEKFSQKLSYIKELKSQNEKKNKIMELKNMVNYLGDMPIINKQIIEVENQYNDSIDEQKNRLDFALNNRCPKQIKNEIIIINQNPQSNGEQKNQILIYLTQEIKQLYVQQENFIDKSQINSALLKMEKIIAFNKLFHLLIKKNNQLYVQSKAIFFKFFNTNLNALEEFLCQCQQDNYFVIYPISNRQQNIACEEEEVVLPQKLFENILLLAKNQFQQDMKLNIPDFENKLENLFNKLYQVFKQYLNKFQQSKENFEFSTLNNVLASMKKLDTINQLIIKYSNQFIQKQYFCNLCNLLKASNNYRGMIKQLEDKIQILKDGFIDLCMNTDQKQLKFHKDRDQYYQRIYDNSKNLDNLIDLLKYYSHNESLSDTSYKQSIEQKINNICSEIRETIDKHSFSKVDNQNCNTNMQNLAHIKDKKLDITNELLQQIQTTIKDAKEFYIGRVEEKFSNFINQPIQFQQFADCLIYVQELSNDLSQFQGDFFKIMEKNLKDFKLEYCKTGGMSKLGVILKASQTGKIIIEKYIQFEGYSIFLFNSKIQRQSIDEVVDKLEGSPDYKIQLKKKFNICDNLYKDIVKKHLEGDKPCTDNLIKDIKNIGNEFKQKFGKQLINYVKNKLNLFAKNQQYLSFQWDELNIKFAIELVAHLFALWTIKNSTHYFEAKEAQDRQNYLFTPHIVQILSIFQILGISSEKEILKNNLIEIKTGEGKSIMLGIAASVLALLGYDVNCACYSQYLSQRDYNAFLGLFNDLGIKEKITYGSFHELFEQIINKKGNVRDVVTHLITNQKFPKVQKINTSTAQQVLLIDEVDFFYNKDFYGKTYNPIASFTNPKIKKLINYIWVSKDQNLTLEDLQSSLEYLNCIKNDKFGNWQYIFDGAVEQMLSDVHKIEQHIKSRKCQIKKNKVGYQSQDRISTSLTYDYKTMFAYLYYQGKGKIDNTHVQEALSIDVNCGRYSYAELFNYFQLVLGVSGTLNTLSKNEQEIINIQFQIQNKISMPSVYGDNKLLFDPKQDFNIKMTELDYYDSICQEIDKKLEGKDKNSQRAVLVYFKSQKDLKKFVQKTGIEDKIANLQRITIDLKPSEKENMIKSATTQGFVSLLTREFARGIDFVVRDDAVNQNGGVHVIQTFLSKEQSEETQLMGRTARQGVEGSYSIVLLLKDLNSTVGFKSEEEVKSLMKDQHNLYKIVKEKRNECFNENYKKQEQLVKDAKKEHDLGMKFIDDLFSNQQDKVQKFIKEHNSY